MGYQLVVADLNNDRRPDIIVVDERSTELAWYENPSWQRHVLATDVPRVINLECLDLNGDGTPEIAMAHHFESTYERSKGTVLLLESSGDVRAPWNKREIDAIPTAHRLRWIKTPAGPWLLVSPLRGAGENTPIYSYKPGEWKRTLVYEKLTGVVHSIHPVDWDGDGYDEILTASFDGLQLLTRKRDGSWSATPLAKGDPRPCPECGSSEIKNGRLGKRRFLAAIEPWHGNQVVVYAEDRGKWIRTILDDSMINGHALAVGDLDGDGRDEIVSGFRGKGFRLSLFYADDASGVHWKRQILDDGHLAAADCKIADFNLDRRPDIACSGASTGNVMLFRGAVASR